MKSRRSTFLLANLLTVTVTVGFAWLAGSLSNDPVDPQLWLAFAILTGLIAGCGAAIVAGWMAHDTDGQLSWALGLSFAACVPAVTALILLHDQIARLR